MSQEKFRLPHDHGETIDGLLERIPDAEVFSGIAHTFSLMSDATRLKILWLLCHSKLCVNNIAAVMGMSAPAVSHHLRILRGANLLTSKRRGKETCYTLAKTDEARFVHNIIDDIFDFQCPRP